MNGFTYGLLIGWNIYMWADSMSAACAVFIFIMWMDACVERLEKK